MSMCGESEALSPGLVATGGLADGNSDTNADGAAFTDVLAPASGCGHAAIGAAGTDAEVLVPASGCGHAAVGATGTDAEVLVPASGCGRAAVGCELCACFCC
jgi:hypothetical protein